MDHFVPSCELTSFLQVEIRFGNYFFEFSDFFGLIIIILGSGRTSKYIYRMVQMNYFVIFIVLEHLNIFELFSMLLKFCRKHLDVSLKLQKSFTINASILEFLGTLF